MYQTANTINLDGFFEANQEICGSRVAVALSGGPDSVCLLHLLNSVKDKYNLTLLAAHLNHNIRENEADRDMQFCIELCKSLDIPLTLESKEIVKLGLKGESVETAARRIRYEFFDSLNCDYIATAHNSNDNAETVLLNILRGSGTKGAGGIPNIRGKIIRPLLNFTKAQILEYLHANSYDYVVDSSNNQNEYSRNKLRNIVFPVLTDINENFSENINRFATLNKQDDDYLTQKALEEYNNAVTKKGLNLNQIQEKHIAVLSRVIKIYFEKQKLSFNNKTADQLLYYFNNNINTKINIEGNLFISLINGLLSLINEKKPKFLVKTEIVNNLLLNNTIDCDKIVGELIISVKKDGDKIKIKGRPNKELRRIYSEKNIEPTLRNLLPVAHDDCGVVWGYKVGIAERVLANENSKNLMRIRVEEENA